MTMSTRFEIRDRKTDTVIASKEFQWGAREGLPYSVAQRWARNQGVTMETHRLCTGGTYFDNGEM